MLDLRQGIPAGDGAAEARSSPLEQHAVRVQPVRQAVRQPHAADRPHVLPQQGVARAQQVRVQSVQQEVQQPEHAARARTAPLERHAALVRSVRPHVQDEVVPGGAPAHAHHEQDVHRRATVPVPGVQQVVPQPEQPGVALAGARLREDVVHVRGVR